MERQLRERRGMDQARLQGNEGKEGEATIRTVKVGT